MTGPSRGLLDAATALLEDLVSRESVVASELTRFELLAGTRTHAHDRLESFFSVVDWIPVTEDVTLRAGEYARKYRRSHSGIGVVDHLLAAPYPRWALTW